MPSIHASIACNLDQSILESSLPLFQSESVEAIEWSFDTLYKVRNIPNWFVELVKAFGEEGRLIGHGVFFSLFSGKWSPEQDAWLDRLERMSQTFKFDHITEHFGFMTGEDFHKGAPISIPFNQKTLALGHDRLKRIYQACQCPVGLENLAFAYSMEEVKKHGAFLNELMEPVNGFIILDLHNLFCHLHNFEVDFKDIISLYPLQKVREIHISGGSWEDSGVVLGKKIRRDTHDDSVPEDVFELLEKAIPLCPNLKYVVLEQIGTGLKTVESQEKFRADFERMKRLVHSSSKEFPEAKEDFLPKQAFNKSAPLVDLQLAKEQSVLSHILENASNYDDVKTQLNASILAKTDWNVEDWSPHMVETVYLIAQKWKSGF